MRLCLVLSVILVLNRCYGYDYRRTKKSPQKLASIEYLTKPTKYITIPVKVHFDKALTDKLAKQYKTNNRAQLKVLTHDLIAEVEAYFRHPSLNQTIKFEILDVKFIMPIRQNMEDNGSTYLKNYCTKQALKKRISNQWWYSILLTGRDLYYLTKNGDKNWHSTARGYLGGICAAYKSCTIVEWDKNIVGYRLTHEIGHSLGMPHDGNPYNECKPHINIMSNKYNPNFPPKAWSTCNRRQLERFLKTTKAQCLRNKSTYQRVSSRG